MAENRAGEVTQTNPPVAPELEVIQGDNVGEVYKVKLDTRIGRERDNDIVLIDPRISRYHTRISLEDGQWMVADLGSSNYTYLNGTPISEPMALHPGDLISLGTTELRLRIPGGIPADEAEVSPPKTDASPKIIVPPVAAQTPAVAPAPAPQPSSRTVPRLAWIAGGVILLFCLAAVIVIYFAVGRFTNGEITAAPDASPSVTKDGDVSDQATDGEQIPADLTLAYEDDFSDSFGGWDDAFDTYTRKVYGNNRYQIEVSTSNLVAWGLANRDVADFEIEVEARMEEGAEDNTYGLLFRFQDRENFYRFDISGDGFFLLSKFFNGEWQTLVDWTEAPQLNTGAGVNNILKVAAFGPNITVWANGQQLATVTDDSLTHGNFGFFAGTFSEPYVWVSYDNLKLWLPQGQEQAIVLIPTATRPNTGPTPTSPPSATPVPPTNTPEPQPTPQQTETAESVEITPTTTPTTSPTIPPTGEPTATPEPLPEYASRNQTLARGETREEGRIIFPVFDSEREVYDIYIADAADGSNRELVQEQASQPALSVDGTNLAYRSWQPDNRGLLTRPLSGGDVWVFNPFFESAQPSFSPVDDSLMFHSRVGGEEPAIYRVVDGVSEVMRREGFPIQGEAAKWSPDGTQFVYSSCLGGKCGIIRSNVEGGVNPVLLSDYPSDTNPEISPDGSTVVFMSNRAGNWEIYAVGINGGNITNLTSDPASDGLPTWSPDGSKIAFVSNRDGEWSIWSMNSDGSNQRRLFALGGPVDAIVPYDKANSRGWTEENIDWAP